MAFEDDMIEAGYSNEQEYLDSLIDDFEENYICQVECELEYNNGVDTIYDEEEERKRCERQNKRETERKLVTEWKEQNPDLAIIWNAFFSTLSYWADMRNIDNRHIKKLNEYYELQTWLNERKQFDAERKEKEWYDNLKELFSLYEDELFSFYFPNDEKKINMSLISQQAHELLSLKSLKPSLWETICSSYVIDAKSYERIEENAFWNNIYKHDMDYEYWKDNNIEQYNQLIKQWIANESFYVYGEWLKNHETEEIEWKHKNHHQWVRFKQNYEIREKNKYIELKIDEHKRKDKKSDLITVKDKNIFHILDKYYIDEDYTDESYFVGDNMSEPFLPDIECTTEKAYDINSLSIEVRQFIQSCISSQDLCNINKDSAKYADKVLTQLWIYTNRDKWGKDAVKKYHENIFRFGNKYSKDFLKWWKEKHPSDWNLFLKTIVPSFKNSYEIVMKFRLWAYDGNKEKFISIANKYLSYWRRTLKFMYGYDVHSQLCNYFHNEPRYKIDFFLEDVDYIKKYTSTKEEIEIWQKELRDKLIWEIFYNGNYQEHYFIESMYTSLQ